MRLANEGRTRWVDTVADGDEVDTNTIRAQQWEKGISCPVLVFRHQLQRLGQEFHPGKCSGLLAVIDESFVAILQHLDIGFRDGNGVYEGCSCIAGEKKQVTDSLGLSSGSSASRIFMKSDMLRALGVVTLGVPTR